MRPMHWSARPIHVIDFEGSRRSGILEYGIVTLRDGAVVGSRTRLCRPIGRVEEWELAVHGIQASAADPFPLFSDEWALFRQLRAEGLFAAHFAAAENHLLKSVWAYPPPSPDFARPGRRVNDWGPWIDTGRLYEQAFPRLESANLQALIDLFGYQAELDRLAEAHCPDGRCAYHAALYDALAAALLLLKFMERPEYSAGSLHWLLRMSCSGARGREVAQQELFE